MRVTYRSFTAECFAESGVTQSLIDEFNDGENFKTLPTDRSLKCYMKCQMDKMDMIYADIAKVHSGHVLENISIFKPHEREIFLRMGNKCLGGAPRADGDRCEVAYLFQLCLKRSDINVSVHFLSLPDQILDL